MLRQEVAILKQESSATAAAREAQAKANELAAVHGVPADRILAAVIEAKADFTPASLELAARYAAASSKAAEGDQVQQVLKDLFEPQEGSSTEAAVSAWSSTWDASADDTSTTRDAVRASLEEMLLDT